MLTHRTNRPTASASTEPACETVRLGPTLTDVRRVRALHRHTMPRLDFEQVNGSLDATARTSELIALYFFSRLDEGADRQSSLHGAFRQQHREFVDAGIAVAGISSDPVDTLQETVAVNRLTYPLLSDEHLLLADRLGMMTFWHGGARHYESAVILCQSPLPAAIQKAFYPLPDPSAVPGLISAWRKRPL